MPVPIVEQRTIYRCPCCRKKKHYNKAASQRHINTCLKNPDRRCWCGGRLMDKPLQRDDLLGGGGIIDLHRALEKHVDGWGLVCPYCVLAEVLRVGCSSYDVREQWDFDAAAKAYGAKVAELEREELAAATGGGW